MQNQGNMVDRVRNLETLMELSNTLAQEMVESQKRLDESQQQMADNQLRIADSLRRIAENQQWLAESQIRKDDLLQQILQAVAVMQADIVLIDETHS